MEEVFLKCGSIMLSGSTGFDELRKKVSPMLCWALSNIFIFPNQMLLFQLCVHLFSSSLLNLPVVEN